MYLEHLFFKLRQQGVGSRKAAALTGYALLVCQVGSDGLRLARRKQRKLQRAFIKFGVVPQHVQLAEHDLQTNPQQGRDTGNQLSWRKL